MTNGDLDMTALIISICVVVPALIAISVCAIIYYAHRNKDRKPLRTSNVRRPSYDGGNSRTRMESHLYTIDLTRSQSYQARPNPSNRSRQPPGIFEQSPPSYETSVYNSNRQPKLMFNSIPSPNQVRRPIPNVSPSVYSTMPPSYAEIFLNPND